MDRLVFSKSVIECRTPCSGNDKERCGGAFSLTVYMNGKVSYVRYYNDNLSTDDLSFILGENCDTTEQQSRCY